MTKLKSKRVEAGMSQTQLAKMAGLNVRTLQHYEQASKPFDHARIDTIMKVCIALSCKIEDILEDQEYIELIKKLPQ